MRVPLLTPPAAPSALPPAGEAPFCPKCAARLVVGQDWCLTCGVPVSGRLRTGPGLRSSLSVVGVTLLLVAGAVAAAYVAASSDSTRATKITASAPLATLPAPVTPVTPGAPVPAAPTAGAPVQGPTGLTPTTLPARPKLPPATPTPTAPGAAGTPKAPAKPTATTPTKPVTVPKTTPPALSPLAASSAAILLDTDAATSYNPYSLAPASFGDPAKAIDGDRTTAWTYTLDPSTAGRTLVGLAVNLKSAQRVHSITLVTASPGMNVEFYGATGAEPVSITDPGWMHLANAPAIKGSSTVTLKTRGKLLDYLLVWITRAPPGLTTGTLGISELTVTS